MADAATFLTLASAGTAAIVITAAAGLRGWQDWLELRRAQIEDPRFGQVAVPVELTRLRARVRRLESIASGSEN